MSPWLCVLCSVLSWVDLNKSDLRVRVFEGQRSCARSNKRAITQSHQELCPGNPSSRFAGPCRIERIVCEENVSVGHILRGVLSAQLQKHAITSCLRPNLLFWVEIAPCLAVILCVNVYHIFIYISCTTSVLCEVGVERDTHAEVGNLRRSGARL